MATSNDQYKRVILVTGSNDGIGYELVRLLAEKGHTVYLASRKEASGKAAQAKLKDQDGVNVKLVQLDVTDAVSIQAAKDTIEKAEGRLDTLVNNAGMSYMTEPQGSLTVSLDTLRKTFEPNFFGLVQTTQAFVPLLRAAPKGYACILNVSMALASNTRQSGPGQTLHFAAYNSSKAAMNSYSIVLAKDLEAEGIKVNMVCPGFVTTKLNGYRPGGKTPQDGAKSLVPWALLGPEDAGKTCLFQNEDGPLPW
ncbi:uncharacterized protein EV420DRAFT_693012 [Desarmillaria tabescens]|uniref:NAD(P)-binding protein n=1 Tax=Armillaria tabescens TaxID=1929756 RepID=A0AA39K2A1_ARMTA|nr:uncharacterized protein EV420DRAFT_693012 [Desarmillaria tabescens]KAK0452130.1 hypothetical protein EV420DRAFT_693012 [Desarmillaria tabescens]